MKKVIFYFMFLTVVFFSTTAQRTVSGKVTDESGEGLPGASIVEANTTNGTITDVDGNYSLSAGQDARLQFSFVGYAAQEIAVNGRQVIDVQMKVDAQQLSEVVILGYSTKEKGNLTGSSTQIGAQEINDFRNVNLQQALTGRVAGVSIAGGSGTPGSTQFVRIRGVGSITGNNAPLYVIDGVPMTNFDANRNQNSTAAATSSSLNTLAGINNDDIASITVLKDASATSAYGARGSNGVIVITTKKGETGAATITASASMGIQDFAVPGPVPLTAAQREQLYYDGLYNSYGTSNDFDRAGTPAFYLENAERLDRGALKKWIDAGRPEGDWGAVMKNPNNVVQNYSVAASGGDKKGTFYASLAYNRTPGMAIITQFDRINASLKGSRQLKPDLKLSVSTQVSHTKQDGILEESAYFSNPVATKFFMPPTQQPYTKDGEINTDISAGNNNPLYLARNDIRRSQLLRGIANATLEWSIIENLKFKSVYSIDHSSGFYKSYGNRNYGDRQNVGGTSFALQGRNTNTVLLNSLNYSFDIQDHNISVTALYEHQSNTYYQLNAYGEDLPADGLTNLDNVTKNKEVGSAFINWLNASFLALANYNYAGRYILDLTYRREGSSRFALGKRFGNFYAIGAAWRINREVFMTPISVISDLKLKASYGVSGNQPGINQYQSLLDYDGSYNEEGIAYPSGFGNSDLTWEKNANYNLGINFAVMKNRLSGSVTYFNKRTFDLLQSVPLSRTTGFNNVTRNAGEMVNKGWEFELAGDIVKTGDITWNMSGNFSIINNEVLKLAKDAEGKELVITTGTRRTAEGHPVREWYMRKWAGVDPENGDPLWYINGKDGETTNNYNQAERAFQGANGIPRYLAGLATEFSYKGIFLNANLSYSGGNQVYEDWARYMKSSGTFPLTTFNGVSELTSSWRQPGDQTDYPKILVNRGGDGQLGARTSTRFLYDGDFIRLRSVALGYDLPKNLIKPLKLEQVRISLQGFNLWTWMKDKRLKYDPEVRPDGFTRFVSPILKSYNLTLNLKF